MIRKLLCWLGWHEYKPVILCMMWNSKTAEYEAVEGFECKYCGKRKAKK